MSLRRLINSNKKKKKKKKKNKSQSDMAIFSGFISTFESN